MFFLLKLLIASGLTSGTIRGTWSSILKQEELSITIQPFFPAIGPNFLAILDPAEKSAISTSSKLKSSTDLIFKILSSP